jgi:glycosyltransferase involved in cell wall biosynthesis
MACGKPVITSNVNPITKFVNHRKTGILVDPGDSEALSESIIELAENPTLAKRIGIASRKMVLHKYSWRVFAERLEKIFRETLQNL